VTRFDVLVGIEIAEATSSCLDTYASIPSRLMVREVFDVTADEANERGPVLIRRRVSQPFLKDYDLPSSSHPSRWASRFDVTHWGFLIARVAGEDAGRAAIAWRSPGVDMIAEPGTAVLWDIRVAPEAQRRGVGRALFTSAVKWATGRGAKRLKIETQNVNVPACEFYASCGCELRAVNRDVYDEYPEEIQLLWYKELEPQDLTG